MSLSRTLGRTWILPSLCILVSATSFADTRLSIQHTESGKESQIQSVMVTSGKVRMEQGADDNMVLLYDEAANTFFAIQPDEKSYMELDPEKAAEMMDQASQMQAQMMAKLQESLKDMPEEQREKMMMLMNRSGQKMPGLPEEPVRYESRAGSDSSGAFTCRWVDVYQGERKVRELCLAEPASVGMPSSDKDTMMSMQKSMKALAKRLGNAGMFQDDMPDGFPVYVRHFGSSGQVTSEQQVQSATHESLDPGLFEIPAGYEKRELPTLPQQ